MNDIFYQLLDILGAAVGQFPLCQRPNAFIGVELRSVGRKMLNTETRVSGEELLERFTLMSGGVIQEDDDGAAQVPQQRTQKRTDFLLTDILKKKEIVEAQSVPLGADRNAGNADIGITGSMPTSGLCRLSLACFLIGLP
jgi:hypothetical protein